MIVKMKMEDNTMMFLKVMLHSFLEDGMFYLFLMYIAGVALRWILIYRTGDNPWISLVPFRSHRKVFSMINLDYRWMYLLVPMYAHFVFKLFIGLLFKFKMGLGIVLWYTTWDMNYTLVFLVLAIVVRIVFVVYLAKSLGYKKLGSGLALFFGSVIIGYMLWKDTETFFKFSDDTKDIYVHGNYVNIRVRMLLFYILLSWTNQFFLNVDYNIVYFEEATVHMTYDYEYGEGALLVTEDTYYLIQDNEVVLEVDRMFNDVKSISFVGGVDLYQEVVNLKM